jgi:hypothetical protein
MFLVILTRPNLEFCKLGELFKIGENSVLRSIEKPALPRDHLEQNPRKVVTRTITLTNRNNCCCFYQKSNMRMPNRKPKFKMMKCQQQKGNNKLQNSRE